MTQILKRGLLLVLVGLFLCCAIGCGGSGAKETDEPTAADREPPRPWGEETRDNILQGE